MKLQLTASECRDLKYQDKNGRITTFGAIVTLVVSGYEESVLLCLPYKVGEARPCSLLEEFYKGDADDINIDDVKAAVYVVPAHRISMEFHNGETNLVGIILDNKYVIMTGGRNNFIESLNYGASVTYEFLDKEYFYTTFERYPVYYKLIMTMPEHQIIAHPVVVKKYTMSDEHIDAIGKDIQKYLFNGYEIQSNNTATVGEDVINVITYVHPEHIK